MLNDIEIKQQADGCLPCCALRKLEEKCCTLTGILVRDLFRKL